MYSHFQKNCELNLLRGTVIDALDMYANIDYLALVNPTLKHKKLKRKVEIDPIRPIPDDLLMRIPKFKGEEDINSLMNRYPKMNPVNFKDKQGIMFEFPKDDLPKRRFKFKHSDKRKYVSRRENI